MGTLASIEDIHFFRPSSTKKSLNIHTTSQTTARILKESDIERQINTLMEKPNFTGVNELIVVVSNKKNHNALSIQILNNILGYLQTIGNIPPSFIKLRKEVNKILEAKRKIYGVK